LANEDENDSQTKAVLLVSKKGRASQGNLAKAYFYSVTNCKKDEKLNIQIW